MKAENPKLQGPEGEYLELRDYFAAAALTGLMANTSACLGTMEGAKESGISAGAGVASMAYYYADAMLKVRNT